jgi:hypothetical protein
VPDLSVSGDNFDLVVVDPRNPTTMRETRSANAIAEPTPDGYQHCRRKISLITKINSCTQSKNEQEFEVSNLNITRRWSLQYTKAKEMMSKAHMQVHTNSKSREKQLGQRPGPNWDETGPGRPTQPIPGPVRRPL